MPIPPVTRKPIPLTIAKWDRELRGVWRLLNGVDRHLRDQGTPWVQSMRAYYVTRLADLIDNAPDGARVPKALLRWHQDTQCRHSSNP